MADIAEALAGVSESHLALILRFARVCRRPIPTQWCEVVETVIERVELDEEKTENSR